MSAPSKTPRRGGLRRAAKRLLWAALALGGVGAAVVVSGLLSPSSEADEDMQVFQAAMRCADRACLRALAEADRYAVELRSADLAAALEGAKTYKAPCAADLSAARSAVRYWWNESMHFRVIFDAEDRVICGDPLGML